MNEQTPIATKRIERAQEILDYTIAQFEKTGVMPTYRMIMQHIEVGGMQTLIEALAYLEGRGLIVRISNGRKSSLAFPIENVSVAYCGPRKVEEFNADPV